MAKASELLEQAAKYRDLAKRAKRLARFHLGEADRVHLLRYGEELEARAARLEKAAEVALAVTLTVGLETTPESPDPPTNGHADPAEKPKL